MKRAKSLVVLVVIGLLLQVAAMAQSQMQGTLVIHRIGTGLLSIAIHTTGSGYVAGDVVTVSGGTATELATVTVVTVSGSTPTAVSIALIGSGYSSTSNVATTGGTGTGLTLDTTISGINTYERVFKAGTTTGSYANVAMRITNTDASSHTMSIQIRYSGAGSDISQVVYDTVAIPANATTPGTNFVLGPGDEVWIQASSNLVVCSGAGSSYTAP